MKWRGFYQLGRSCWSRKWRHSFQVFSPGKIPLRTEELGRVQILGPKKGESKTWLRAHTLSCISLKYNGYSLEEIMLLVSEPRHWVSPILSDLKANWIRFSLCPVRLWRSNIYDHSLLHLTQSSICWTPLGCSISLTFLGFGNTTNMNKIKSINQRDSIGKNSPIHFLQYSVITLSQWGLPYYRRQKNGDSFCPAGSEISESASQDTEDI